MSLPASWKLESTILHYSLKVAMHPTTPIVPYSAMTSRTLAPHGDIRGHKKLGFQIDQCMHALII